MEDLLQKLRGIYHEMENVYLEASLYPENITAEDVSNVAGHVHKVLRSVIREIEAQVYSEEKRPA